jgi:hypothetical protein
MERDVLPVGIDMGNSGLKMVEFTKTGLKQTFIPNVIGEAITLTDPPSSTSPDEDVLSVRVLTAKNEEHREEKFIGKLALQQNQSDAEQDFLSRNKSEGPAINIIVPAALGLTGSKLPIIAGIGATFTDIEREAPLLQDALTRKHKIEYRYGSKSGKILEPEVIFSTIYPQCAAGIFSMATGDDGRARKERTHWVDETILGVDIGQGQFNIAVMEGMVPIKEACFSGDEGFYQIAEDVLAWLSKNYHVSGTVPQIQKFISQGYYQKHNQKIDLTEIIDIACGNLIQKIYNATKSRISKKSKILFDQINRVVALGASAQITPPFIGAAFGLPVEVSDNPRGENARGLGLIAWRQWNKLPDAIREEKLVKYYGR